MDLNKIIERKDSAAQYMVDEITYICKNLDKRSPCTRRPVSPPPSQANAYQGFYRYR